MLKDIIEERKKVNVKEFRNCFVEMSPLQGRDMHNRPPLYDTDLSEVEAMNKFIRTITAETAQIVAREVIRKVNELVDKNDPCYPRKTNKKYWGNTLRADLQSLEEELTK